MNIVNSDNGDKMVLAIEGRVDTNTAPTLQEAILAAFQKKNNIEVNFLDVAYVSSAGLRALLIGQKTAQSKGGSMVITNVSDTVMEVFSVTGFKSILKIQ